MDLVIQMIATLYVFSCLFVWRHVSRRIKDKNILHYLAMLVLVPLWPVALLFVDD